VNDVYSLIHIILMFFIWSDNHKFYVFTPTWSTKTWYTWYNKNNCQLLILNYLSKLFRFCVIDVMCFVVHFFYFNGSIDRNQIKIYFYTQFGVNELFIVLLIKDFLQIDLFFLIWVCWILYINEKLIHRRVALWGDYHVFFFNLIDKTRLRLRKN
jgi:hypothetical protein